MIRAGNSSIRDDIALEKDTRGKKLIYKEDHTPSTTASIQEILLPCQVLDFECSSAAIYPGCVTYRARTILLIVYKLSGP